MIRRLCCSHKRLNNKTIEQEQKNGVKSKSQKYETLCID